MCNVSRIIVGFAMRRYASVTVVHVTAPPHVLALRLARRCRPSDGNFDDQIARSPNSERNIERDVVMRDVGRPEVGIRRMVNLLRDEGFVAIY